MVASRCPYRLSLAAFVRRSTSASVRYSRVRHSAFGRRRGVTTVRISVVGATSLRCDLAIEIKPPHHLTVRRIVFLRTVFKALFCDYATRWSLRPAPSVASPTNFKLGRNYSSWGFLVLRAFGGSHLRKPSHRPVYILPNARREVSSGLSLPPCWGRFRVRGVARFILKEVAMPIDSILVSVGVVAMFAILAGALLWGDFQTRAPRKDIN